MAVEVVYCCPREGRAGAQPGLGRLLLTAMRCSKLRGSHDEVHWLASRRHRAAAAGLLAQAQGREEGPPWICPHPRGMAPRAAAGVDRDNRRRDPKLRRLQRIEVSVAGNGVSSPEKREEMGTQINKI